MEIIKNSRVTLAYGLPVVDTAAHPASDRGKIGILAPGAPVAFDPGSIKTIRNN